MVTRSAGKSAATGDSEGSSLQGGDTVTPPVLTIAPRPDDTTPPEGEELDLDIPTFLLTVQQRLRRKHKPEAVAKSMPTHHPLWTTANICQYVHALELQFTSEHYRACGVEPPLATLPPSVSAARTTTSEADAAPTGLDYYSTTDTVQVGTNMVPTSTPAGGAATPSFTPASQFNFGMDSQGRWCMMDATGKVVQCFMPSIMTPAADVPLGAVTSVSSSVGGVSMTSRAETPAKTHATPATSHELTPTLSGVAEMHGAVFALATSAEKLRTRRLTVPSHQNHRATLPCLASTTRGPIFLRRNRLFKVMLGTWYGGMRRDLSSWGIETYRCWSRGMDVIIILRCRTRRALPLAAPVGISRKAPISIGSAGSANTSPRGRFVARGGVTFARWVMFIAMKMTTLMN